eukprot:scaffold25542_cov60-Cyclotella_meneghiniana.AAC.6
MSSDLNRYSLSYDTLEDYHDSAMTPLSSTDAINLTKQMHSGIKSHIKDRTYRFKSYKSCFLHSHAVSWAVENIDKDKRLAVQRLNEMVDFGLVQHVVDPSKRFRLNEKRTLYFRINLNALDEQPSQRCNNGGESLTIVGKQSTVVLGQMESMRTKIDGLDHVLQETVRELNAANGRLELMHQRMCTLVSQQISLFGVVVILTICSIGQSNYWITIQPRILTTILLMTLGGYGMTLAASWKTLDCTQFSPSEEVDGESSSDDVIPNNVVRTFTKRQSFSQLVSNKFGSVVRSTALAGRKSIQRPTILSRESYSLPAVEEWPHRPLLICVNTPVSNHIEVPGYGNAACPLGRPFKFSSNLFEGICIIRIKDSNSDDVQGDKTYFSGRKRIFQSVVQGRFKEEGLKVSDVLTGHEFSRPLKNLPHPWILKTASNFIGKVAPGSNVVVHTDQPFVEAILAGTSQALRGDEPGNEPNILSREIDEDCTIFGGAFSKEVSVSRRKKILSNPEKAKQYTFDTETIYTFDFYQNLFDANSYALDLGFTQIGCAKVLDGQPIQWLGKLRDGRYLWLPNQVKENI